MTIKIHGTAASPFQLEPQSLIILSAFVFTASLIFSA